MHWRERACVQGCCDSGLICLGILDDKQGRAAGGEGPTLLGACPRLWVCAGLRDPGKRSCCCVSVSLCEGARVCLHPHGLGVHAEGRPAANLSSAPCRLLSPGVGRACSVWGRSHGQ